MIGLDGVHGGADDRIVQRLKLALLVEDDIGGKFHLHQAPVVTGAKPPMDGTELPGPFIEPTVKLFGIQAVRKVLGLIRIGDREEGVVGHLEGDAGFAQPLRQPVVAIEIDLQAKRCPGGHANIAKAEQFVDEVEVVV